jgi:nucleoside 2-deoxyribosyltransferase
MKKKIYIAGKVTGLPKQEVIDKFSEVQINLERCGFTVINPIEVVKDFDASWEFAMKKCIKALVDCDAVYLMACHTQSVGAMIEMQLAINLKIPCVNNIFKLADLWNN